MKLIFFPGGKAFSTMNEKPLKQTCGSCRFHDTDGFLEIYVGCQTNAGVGLCRRVPPMPDVLRTITSLSSNWDWPIAGNAIYPETAADDWCGEWRDRITSP